MVCSVYTYFPTPSQPLNLPSHIKYIPLSPWFVSHLHSRPHCILQSGSTLILSLCLNLADVKKQYKHASYSLGCALALSLREDKLGLLKVQVPDIEKCLPMGLR